jgi:hypothetical protein
MLLDILTMHLHINVKSTNNISKWQVGFNSAFKGLMFTAQNFTQLRYIYIYIYIGVKMYER